MDLTDLRDDGDTVDLEDGLDINTCPHRFQTAYPPVPGSARGGVLRCDACGHLT